MFLDLRTYWLLGMLMLELFMDLAACELGTDCCTCEPEELNGLGTPGTGAKGFCRYITPG